MRAGVSSRGLTHADANAHAVDDLARLSGALDAVCGVQVVRLTEAWPPVERPSCDNCAKALAPPVLVSA